MARFCAHPHRAQGELQGWPPPPPGHFPTLEPIGGEVAGKRAGSQVAMAMVPGGWWGLGEGDPATPSQVPGSRVFRASGC